MGALLVFHRVTIFSICLCHFRFFLLDWLRSIVDIEVPHPTPSHCSSLALYEQMILIAGPGSPISLSGSWLLGPYNLKSTLWEKREYEKIFFLFLSFLGSKLLRILFFPPILLFKEKESYQTLVNRVSVGVLNVYSSVKYFVISIF